ncbi:anti-sigma factor family protein [Phytohabitans rumicis]|uniref:anti-sigma factor family protein n=1 Tax=Phytohabitans rumicis TaxID=1076125 RepID=UPI0031E7EE3D
MSAESHDTQLGAYVLGTLDPGERRDIDAHLAGCATCRADLAALEAVKDVLDDIPPEALLHGPPDADLVLQRTLRQVRVEAAAGAGRRWVPAVAAAAVLLAGALGAGVAVGRGTAPGTEALPTPAPTVTASAPVPGTRVGTTLDASTNVRMTAKVVPAAGWVRVNAAVNGIPAGENCRLLVVSRDGTREIAAGWIVSEKGETDGTTLDGSAAVDPADVVAVEVQNTEGRTFVTLPL